METRLPLLVGSNINYMHAVYATDVAHGQLRVAVDHSQLWTMAY